jgi:predicted  nucleic acid-binding Zn-ribbon protein
LSRLQYYEVVSYENASFHLKTSDGELKHLPHTLSKCGEIRGKDLIFHKIRQGALLCCSCCCSVFEFVSERKQKGLRSCRDATMETSLVVDVTKVVVVVGEEMVAVEE